MTKVLVLGIGNRLMRDDGIGVNVVEALMKGNKENNIRYLVGETDVDFCLTAINDADRLFIVDATNAGEEAGQVTCLALEDFAVMEKGISLHNLHLFSIIPVMYPQLEVEVIGIEAHTIDYGFGLSDTLKLRMHTIIHKVQQIIQLHL